MPTMQKRVEELFAVQAHLGHKKNRIHPRAKRYIYTVDNGVSIIDLTQTVDLLERAKKFVSDLAQANKKLLVVCTKKIASSQAEKYAKEFEMAFITLKWPAGLLTNFEHIFKNVKKMNEMAQAKQMGEWSGLVKHEQSALSKELHKLERSYGGLSLLSKLPDALFVVDVKKEKNAVTEARRMHIPVIALLDTNVDPTLVEYPIPANDDSLSSIEYIMQELLASYPIKKDN